MPSKDWLKLFIKRYGLRERFADSVKPDRANITPEMVNSFVENLKRVLEGVPESNIFNYDETNFRNHPGQEKANIILSFICS